MIIGSDGMKIITVKDLSKEYKYSVKNKNKGFIHNLFNRDEKVIKAVNNISFEVEKGETLLLLGLMGQVSQLRLKCLRVFFIQQVVVSKYVV